MTETPKPETVPSLKQFSEMTRDERDAFEREYLGRRPSLAEIERRQREQRRA